MNRTDVRVVQRGCGFGFPLEPAESLRIIVKVIGKEFESDAPTQLQVLGFVDDAHTTTSDHSEDEVVRKPVPNGFRLLSHCPEILGAESGQVNEKQVLAESLS